MAVTPASVRVSRKRPLAPSFASVTSVANEMILGTVHRSPVSCHIQTKPIRKEQIYFFLWDSSKKSLLRIIIHIMTRLIDTFNGNYSKYRVPMLNSALTSRSIDMSEKWYSYSSATNSWLSSRIVKHPKPADRVDLSSCQFHKLYLGSRTNKRLPCFPLTSSSQLCGKSIIPTKNPVSRKLKFHS